MNAETPYNVRLFAHGVLRPYFHRQRYLWLRQELERLRLRPRRVIELGCFDAKTLFFLPCFPDRYLGLDANWEGGLELGQSIWQGDPRVELQLCHSPEEIRLRDGERFDIGVAMEVFEYLPDEWIAGYLQKLAGLVEGYLFVSTPVERGLPFTIRYLTKMALGFKRFDLTFAEFCNLMLGRVHRVPHQGHKGFDDRRFLKVLSRHFDVVKVSGLFPGFGPPSLNFQRALVARPRAGKRPSPKPHVGADTEELSRGVTLQC